MKLNEQQLEIVHTTYPHVLVAAGAGSGKTACLIERIKYILSEGYEPKNIYAITYTNAAAEELKSRLPVKSPIFAGTIHGLANRILLQNNIDTSWAIQSENFEELFNLIQENYDTIKIPQVDYLLVDEFQDICDDEYDFIMNMLQPKEFMFCGDASQSIFSFKGSNYEYFLSLTEDSDVKVYELNYNYRSGVNIIDFAENFILSVRKNYFVHNISQTDYYGNVRKMEFSIDTLLDEINDFYYDYKDIFVLTRTNQEIKDIQFILNKYEIPNDTFKKSDLDNGELAAALTRNSVKILTIHSAKGLEARKVIVLGTNCFNDEEKRICYVAATRAKEDLVWLTKKRTKKKKTKLLNWG